MIIGVKQLGLAAYLRLHGAVLVGVKDKVFQFETDKSLTDWRVEYGNSCCAAHDSLVCELRHHLKD